MPSKSPNVLYVVLDTQRRDRLSVYGAARETSPELEKFAAQSSVFARAVSAAQWTVPSHTSMFTGLYSSTHQVTQADGQLSGAYPALAEILRGAGYHTAAFCNNPLVGVLNNGLQRGFERFYNYASAAPFRPTEERRGRLQREVLRTFRRYFARPLGNQFAQSDALFRFSLHPFFVPLWTRLINYKGNTAASIDDLIAYWGAHTAGGTDKPLFAFLNLMGVHTPYNPPQDDLDRVAPGVRHNRHAYRFMREFNADAARWASPTDPPLADWERQTLDDFYDAEIANQDYHLGRLLKYLGESGALENTLVIICADHGEGHGDHGFAGHSFVVYQELVHVPLVIRYPDHFPAGKRIATNISTRRLFHTVLEAAGVKPPLDEADPNADIEHLTLKHAANGEPDIEQGVAFAEAFPPEIFLGVIQHRNAALIKRLQLAHVRRGVYHDQYKLAMVGDQVEGLFDIGDDPAETRDIAAQNGALTADLKRQISGFVAQAESRRADTAMFAPVDDMVLDQLRALGYIE
ncbi:MAG: sulfatase [Chloroflexota bacterium]